MPVQDVCEGVQGQPRKAHIPDLQIQDALFRLASSSESNLIAMVIDVRSSNITATLQSTSTLQKGVRTPAAALGIRLFWVLAFPESLSFTRAGSVSLMICTPESMIFFKFPIQCSLAQQSLCFARSTQASMQPYGE